MENETVGKKGMPSLQKQYLSMLAMAVILVTVGIFFSVKAFRSMEKPMGTELSDTERDSIVNLFSLVDAADEMAESDTTAALVTLNEGFEKLDEMDGRKMESGRKFRKESSVLLMGYAVLEKIKDIESDCEGVKEARVGAEKIMESQYLVIPFRPVGRLTMMYGDEEFYEAAKRKNVEIVKLRFAQNVKNCK